MMVLKRMDKIWANIFVSFLILGMISGTAIAKDVDLRVTASTSSSSRGSDNENINAGYTFYVHLRLTNQESTANITPSDGIDVSIDIDGLEVYDESDLHVDENITPGSDGYLVISSSNFNDDWKDGLMGYECKDDMEIEVRISGDLDSITDTAELTIEGEDNDVDILHITLDPDQPLADSNIVVIVKDEDGDEIRSVSVTIWELGSDDEWDASDKNYGPKTTDSNGEYEFVMNQKFKNAKGKYQIDAYREKYCKDTVTFDISKKLVLTGPSPDKPMVGQSFAMRITDEAGNPLRLVTVILSPGLNRATTDSNGYARFTMSSAGSYSAASSTIGYDDSNVISVTVSEQPSLDVSITPSEPKTGETVTVTVKSDGNAVTGASVTMTLPDGSDKTYTTASGGKAAYTPVLSGYHSVDATKTGYNTGTAGFTVQDSFQVTIPDLSDKQEGDEISVVVKDKSGGVVPGAAVSLLGTGVSGTTDVSGVYKFTMLKTGSYTIHVTKDGFESKDVPLKSQGTLTMKLSALNVEAGEKVKITIYDESGIKVYGNIQITQPDGTRETANKDEYDYIPQQTGEHSIIASKENYASASETLTVMLRSILFDLKIDADTLIITALSGGEPATQVTLTVTTPDGQEKEAVTDKDGIALIKAETSGEYQVSTNDPTYESGTVTIEKKGWSSLIWWVILILLVLLFLIMLVGVGVFHWHFKKKKGKYKREKGSSLA